MALKKFYYTAMPRATSTTPIDVNKVLVATLPANTTYTQLRIDSDGVLYAIRGNNAGLVNKYNLNTGTYSTFQASITRNIRDMDLNGNELILMQPQFGGTNAVVFYNKATGAVIRQLGGSAAVGNYISMGHHGNVVYTANLSAVKVIDAVTGALLATPTHPTRPISLNGGGFGFYNDKAYFQPYTANKVFIHDTLSMGNTLAESPGVAGSGNGYRWLDFTDDGLAVTTASEGLNKNLMLYTPDFAEVLDMTDSAIRYAGVAKHNGKMYVLTTTGLVYRLDFIY